MEAKQPLIILTGPTAVGKTNMSVNLAKKVGGEIISADSMQVYRHMDIGSAKIMPEEMGGIPHHMIDILDPWEEFNVVVFQKKARQYISEIISRGRIPILVGGTGFYIQAVLYDIDFTENKEDGRIRESLERAAMEKGCEFLHQRLEEVDPGAAASIHAHNVKRVIRALEYHIQTGHKISEHNERERNREAAYRFCYFVLNDDRQKLYSRIDTRVEGMLAKGLVEEVKALRAMGCTRDMISMQGLGYKEILTFLEGECTLERAVYLIRRDTRHFAKRQLTWFRREKEALMIEKEAYHYQEEEIVSHMLACMRDAEILPAGKRNDDSAVRKMEDEN